MFTLIRTEDFNSYLLRHFICDDITDLSNIVSEYKPKNELYPGWTGVVPTKSGAEKYILMNDKKTWSKVTVDSAENIDIDLIDGGNANG